jgi:hypothetical protein
MATISDAAARDVAPATPIGEGTRRDSELGRVRTLARVMDRYYLDPLIGFLIPGGGDVLGSMIGIYTVTIAARRKVSPVIIARMLMNLAIDALIGFIPLLGDLFDIGFKANTRNVDLLTARASQGGRATARDWLFVIGAAAAYVAVMALVIWGIVSLLRAIF